MLAVKIGGDFGINFALLLLFLLDEPATLESESSLEFSPKPGGGAQPCTLLSCSLDEEEISLSDGESDDEDDEWGSLTLESSEGLEWQAMKPTVLFSTGLVSTKSGRVREELAEFLGGAACCVSVTLGFAGDTALATFFKRLLSLEGDGGVRSLPETSSADESTTTG